MKKIITAILSAMLILQSAMCVSALTQVNPVYNVTTPITLDVKATGGSTWSSAVTINEGDTVSYRAEIDMTNVKAKFNELMTIGKANTTAENVRAVSISGIFAVTLEYPTAVTLPEEITKGVDEGGEDMAGFSANAKNAFTETNRTLSTVGDRTTLTINYSVKPGITGGIIEDNLENYLGDMYIEADGVSVLKAGAPHTAKGTITGNVSFSYTGDNSQFNVTVNFAGNEPQATINFVTPAGPGGGSLSYTLSFVSNGGTEFEAKSYRNGATVNNDDLPVPEKDGFVFTGWYQDKELTEKFDSVKMTRNVTVYAGWRKKDIPGGPVPEMLNGDDHFAYVIGYPDGTVQPYGSITRAEVVTIFFRLLKDDIRDTNLTYENDYSDVAEGSWYNGAISTMTALGIVKGKSGDKFAPNDDITRGEFAAIVSRFADKAAEISHDFTDVDGHWAETDIYNAAAHGWIMGYEDESFRPDRDITRAEAMTLINRVCARVPETPADLLGDMDKWSDNMDTSAWYYIAVQEATNSHVYERKENEYEKWTEMRENRDWSTYEK